VLSFFAALRSAQNDNSPTDRDRCYGNSAVFTLVGLVRIWEASPPDQGEPQLLSQVQHVVQQHLQFTRRFCCLAAVLWPLASSTGCALWNKELLDPNHYRDSRAVDIDNRLQKDVPIVKNPF